MSDFATDPTRSPGVDRPARHAPGPRSARQGRPENHSFWTNPAFHDLARQIEREVDEGRRTTMVRPAEAILESDPPLLPVAYEKIYDAWHDRVRGQNSSTFFGIYDVVRWDTVSVAS